MVDAPKVPLGITFLALAGVIATMWLGHWQSGRAEAKLALQSQFETARTFAPVRIDERAGAIDTVAFRMVEVQGKLDDSHTILLDNRLRAGVPGYEVVTPLVIGASSAVLVNRGWVRASPDRTVLPNVSITADIVTLRGVAVPVSARFVELSDQTVSGRLWQNLDFEKYRRRSGLPLLPMVIQLETDMPDGLDRNWPRLDLRIDTNRAYAMQWYTMAAAIFVIYIIFYVRRKRA